MESTSRIFKLVRSQRTETFLSFYTVGHLVPKLCLFGELLLIRCKKFQPSLLRKKNIRNPRIHVSENYNILIYYESGYLKFKLSTEGILSLESSYQGGKGWALAVLKENVIFYYSNYYDNTEYKSKKQFRLHDVSSHEEDKSLVNDGFNSAWVVDATIHNDSVIFTGDEELFVFNVSNFKSPKGIFKQKIKNSKWKFVSHTPWIVCETEYYVSSAFHLLNEVGKNSKYLILY